jgi:hypothetical protein
MHCEPFGLTSRAMPLLHEGVPMSQVNAGRCRWDHEGG